MTMTYPYWTALFLDNSAMSMLTYWIPAIPWKPSMARTPSLHPTLHHCSASPDHSCKSHSIPIGGAVVAAAWKRERNGHSRRNPDVGLQYTL